jgi:hypothetical protein
MPIRGISHALISMAYSSPQHSVCRAAYNVGSMQFTLYFSTAPAPKAVTREHLERLIPVLFSTEEDALHGAALVIRGGQYPWLIEGPGVRLDAQEIGKRCEPMLRLFKKK